MTVQRVEPPQDPPGARRWLREHAADLAGGLDALLADAPRIEAWGRELADRLLLGHRLLVAGNGGSAAEAQHLTAELVGRFEGERTPLSAIALHAETSSLSAIVNDYGSDEMFARQVAAHGRPGDVLLGLSTSGSSANVLSAVRRARELGLVTWALTGPAPNPLAALCDDALAVPADSTSAVQEVHLVAVHALCAALDARVAERQAHGGALERPAAARPGVAAGVAGERSARPAPVGRVPRRPHVPAGLDRARAEHGAPEGRGAGAPVDGAVRRPAVARPARRAPREQP